MWLYCCAGQVNALDVIKHAPHHTHHIRKSDDSNNVNNESDNSALLVYPNSPVLDSIIVGDGVGKLYMLKVHGLERGMSGGDR